MICIAATLLTLALAVLFMNGRALGITPIASEEAGSGLFTGNDLDADWDTSSATKITLSDSGSTVHGNGAYVYNGNVYIVYAGRYVLTGELTDGSVIVSANKSDKVWLSLNGAAIHCGGSAALRVEQADKVFLTLAEGTENTLSSGAEYSAEAEASGIDGAIYSRDDLTINGSGTLVVEGAYKHGVVCNDDLVITGGNIAISAAQDGVHANDSVRIREAELSISAGDDGITVSNDDETAFLHVESGSITITECYEGLEAIDVTIAGGTVDITASDDGINANGSGAGSVIRITDGDITITNPSGRDGDGLDSNGSIYIEGGRVFISVSDSGGNSAIDYGSENGGECVVSGGTVIACGSSMMAEGFDAASPQGFVMHSASGAAGTAVSLKDSAGRELLAWEVPCGFSSVVLSAPGFSVGDVCTLTVSGAEEQITIDNVSSSGFAPAGMFGGGMRGGRGLAGGQDIEPSGTREGDLHENGTDERPGGPDFSGGREPFDGMEPPDDMEAPDGMERPDGMEPPNGMEAPDSMDSPYGMGRPDGMTPPDGADLPGGGSEQNGGQEGGGRPFMPEDGRFEENGAIPGQAESGGASSSGLSMETAVLLGVSVLTLLAGLLFAVKIRH